MTERLTGEDLLAKNEVLSALSYDEFEIAKQCGYVDEEGKVFLKSWMRETMNAKGGKFPSRNDEGISESEWRKRNEAYENSEESIEESSENINNENSITTKGPERIIRITLIETGGEFTSGTISNDETIDFLRNKIKDGVMSSYFDGFDASHYDNEFHVYGPHVPDSTVIIEESYDVEVEYDDERNYSGIFTGKLAETGIRTYQSSNPFPPKLKRKELLIYTKKNRKEN